MRARRRLEQAPSSACPHCGRVTKTVDGMCADCWGVKDPVRAKRWLSLPPRKPFVDPVNLLWVLGAIVAFVLVVVFVTSEWT